MANAGRSSAARPLAGLATVLIIGLIVALAIQLFRGAVFDDSVEVTVVAVFGALVGRRATAIARRPATKLNLLSQAFLRAAR